LASTLQKTRKTRAQRSLVDGHQVRISAGDWRSRVLRFPSAPGLRPTGDRVRQTLFNWLGQTMHGKSCLDAFAGSGALGFEAASRGASRVVLCEVDRGALTALRANQAILAATQCQIVSQDALMFLRGTTEKFDVVFCDPPFSQDMHSAFLAAVLPQLAPDGVVYVESPTPLDTLAVLQALYAANAAVTPNPPSAGSPRYAVLKSGKAGAVYFGLLGLVRLG
jgi:16S rRNA (guanine966-N2)-methyltransferase